MSVCLCMNDESTCNTTLRDTKVMPEGNPTHTFCSRIFVQSYTYIGNNNQLHLFIIPVCIHTKLIRYIYLIIASCWAVKLFHVWVLPVGCLLHQCVLEIPACCWVHHFSITLVPSGFMLCNDITKYSVIGTWCSKASFLMLWITVFERSRVHLLVEINRVFHLQWSYWAWDSSTSLLGWSKASS